MGKVETAFPPSRLPMLRQLALSITATVAATLILAGAQYEIAVLRPAAPEPELTSGGKFAARVEALRAAAADVVPAVIAPPRIPLLVADTALHDLPLPSAMQDGAPATVGRPAEPPRVKRVARAEPRHRTAEAGLDVLPPRRDDSVGATVQAPVVAAQLEAGGLLSTTKGLFSRAVGFGGAVIDRLNPMNLLP